MLPRHRCGAKSSMAALPHPFASGSNHFCFLLGHAFEHFADAGHCPGLWGADLNEFHDLPRCIRRVSGGMGTANQRDRHRRDLRRRFFHVGDPAQRGSIAYDDRSPTDLDEA